MASPVPHGSWQSDQGLGWTSWAPRIWGKARVETACPTQEEWPRWGVGMAVSGRDSASASLCPQVPPSIREDGHRTNVSGMAGQSLTLECDVNGFPAPEIVWLKDGQLVGVLWGGLGCGWDLDRVWTCMCRV